MKKKNQKVIIVGGGFAGIAAVKSLANTHFDVLLIDKKNHHVFQPLLYQVASAALSPGDISVPLREVAGRSKNIKVLLDKVTHIDKEQKSITCESGETHKFDYLILAPGSKPFYFGNNTWSKIAPGLKTLEDAINIRNKVLKSFEECERNNSDQLNFVIIGAGPTGVELAGAFAEIAYDILLKEFKSFDAKKAKIYLIEGGEDVLPAYSGYLSKKAKQYIERLGVIVLTNNRVTEITDDHIKINDKIIKTNNVIWAAGNKASPLLDSLKTEKDSMGRIYVNPDLSIMDNPSIYVLGDSAHFTASNGKALPALAPVATQQGRHVARQLKKGKSLPFNYLDKGTMATIGNFKAVMDFRGIRIAGVLAWLSWCFVHILFLINFRNKILVFMQWVLAFFLRKKGVRIITDKKN